MPVSSGNTETPRKNVLPASWARLSSIKLIHKGFPVGSDGKESVCNEGDLGLIPKSEIAPGEGDGNPLQYSCLENPMDREA